MNNISKKIIDNLLAEFPTEIQEKQIYSSKNPIGIEIEVKWRYFFPDLWNRFLSHTSYNNLSESDKHTLDSLCDKQEETLIPKLNKTVECGLNKGLDKYWEFAFQPVTNIDLLQQQLSILENHNIIPPGQHSLHITIGNMKPNKDAYYFLLLLDMISSDKERINTGFNKDKPSFSATWARKGYGGLFQKESRQLMYGSTTAVELRTLFYDTNNNNEELLYITTKISDIIIDKQNGIFNDEIAKWNNFIAGSQIVLSNNNLADKNWKKPNLTPEYWIKYIDKFNIIQEDIIPLFNSIFPELNSKNSKNHKHLI